MQSEKGTSPRRMDRLRRSFRDSFRRRKEHVPESSKPHQWHADEAGVRAGTCNFHVKVSYITDRDSTKPTPKGGSEFEFSFFLPHIKPEDVSTAWAYGFM